MDYAKLKVVDLKAELKRRGLPQSGLKQALIERLQAADDQPTESREEAPATAAPSQEAQPDATKVPGSSPVPSQHVALDAQVPPNYGDAKVLPSIPMTEVLSTLANIEETASSDRALETEALALPTPSQPMPTVEEPPTTVADPEPLPQITKLTSVTPLSTQTSLGPEEVVEDRRKRKRRSQSPAPSAEAIAQKRAKQEEEGTQVTLAEGMDVDKDTTDGLRDVASRSPTKIQDDAASTTESSHPHVTPSEQRPSQVSQGMSPAAVQTPNGNDLQSADPNNAASDSKAREKPQDLEHESALNSQPPKSAATKDGRFKGLFQGKSDMPRPSSPTQDDRDDDRTVEPALHPATSALYIRDFMRPLQHSALKEHLISLATPPQTSPNSSVVKEFFLDPIKTHCLALFTNVSAASRVRTAIHNRVWPDERTRRPLWADFIPEEKVDEWIDVEQKAGGGRMSASKRWEVVYRTPRDNGADTDELEAVLQEVGTSGTSGPSHPGVKGAPLGPRSHDVERNGPKAPTADAPAPRTGDSGFMALDSLFKSTAAKPKLYYLPSSKDIVDKRLDALEDHIPRERGKERGPVRGWEMRRFTFERNDLVDHGPEFGNNYRGGGSYRGRGGFVPRGGGGGGGGRNGYGRDRRDRW